MSSHREEYNRAMRDIRSGLTARVGGTSAETRAAAAYAGLVREGEEAPIKAKYGKGRYLKQVRK